MKKNMNYYINLIKERKISFITVFTIIVLIGVLKLFLTEKLYVSSGAIEIPKYEAVTSNSFLNSFNYTRNRVHTPSDEAEIIQSNAIIEEVIHELNFTNTYYTYGNLLRYAIEKEQFPYDVTLLSHDTANIALIIYPYSSKDARFEIIRQSLTDKVIINNKVLNQKVLYSGLLKYGEKKKVGPYLIQINKKIKTLPSFVYSVNYTNEHLLIDKIKRNLRVTPVIKDSSIIGIDYKDVTPMRAKIFIEKLLEVYSRENLKINTKRVLEAIKIVDKQLVDTKLKLDKSAKKLKEYQSSNLLLNVTDEFKNRQNQIIVLEEKKQNIVLQKNVYEKILEHIIKGEDVGNIVVDDKGITNLIQQRDDAVAKQKELLGKYTPKYSKVIEITKKITSIRNMLNDKILYIIGNLKTQEETLNNLIDNVKLKIKNLPAKKAHLNELLHNYKVDTEIYQELLKNKMKMSTDVVKAEQYTRVVDKPDYYPYAIYPRYLLSIIIIIMLAFIFAFIAVLIRNTFDTIIRKPEDILRITKIPLFGIVPFVKSKNYNKIFLLDSENTHIVESFRKIRTNLEYAGNKEKGKLILVTSSYANEGKTTFAANLAVSHAMLDKKVVIVNLDLRIPQLHMKFDIDNTQGVSEILAAKVSVSDVVHPYTDKTDSKIIKHLDVITSGAVPPNPAELIDTPRLDSFFNELREMYDIIILDSPPLREASESFVLATKSDVILSVVKAESSKIDSIEYFEKISEGLKKSKSLGIILVSVAEEYMQMPVYDKNYALFVEKNSKKGKE
ncbi:tyrosine-protein kinase family protein [Sulfurimonas sp.]|uniref:polysaccharide biosynthesis tyrosine autokinase n=1 Tax=Sulfurimonas sp. TaxID=2022749 RepID=UPI002631A5E1|nr:tyrosine-protein kinase family protein [Sulfurimonas sp.]